MPERRPRVLFVYADRVAAEMGGTGIRAVELARALAPDAEVSVAATETDGSDIGVPVATFSPHAPRDLVALAEGADMIVAQPQWPLAMRALGRSGAQLVFDLYDPELFGTFEHFADRPPRLQRAMAAFAADRVGHALRLGDRIICAGERQRDLWIGALLAAGRIESGAYDRDHSLRSLIETVPFGLPDEPPRRNGATGPREALGISPDEELVLWNGGIWSWLDVDTAIRAISLLRERRSQARLVFMGASRSGTARAATERARSLASELGLDGGGVIFSEDWVPYGERGAWLLDADCALYADQDRLEARYAHRTRLLDCFWAGLPIACTRGDELSELVERKGLGATSDPGDPEGLAQALEEVLDTGRESYREPLAAVAAERTWSRVAAPLARWSREPVPPRRRGQGSPVTVGTRARTAAYVAVAGGAAGLRLPLPRLG